MNTRHLRGLLLVEDVTESEQLKQRLQLYEHLAIMGKLTLCVAHELNNPLDGIRRYLSLAIMKKEEPRECGALPHRGPERSPEDVHEHQEPDVLRQSF